jgi:hypothetical protein
MVKGLPLCPGLDWRNRIGFPLERIITPVIINNNGDRISNARVDTNKSNIRLMKGICSGKKAILIKYFE